ncbi:Formyltetrahydrofolate deformylase [BD1-7 clade bacterium]|uniref:Formyltetrahydrofolate deformylase n=1 Tax=BD1-7 clade bacterium TaxID=2029982 RepID=A0A5S9NM11_9GAMM|nr:Formyltetrahydrofolate deformylase [BD1-7 clade bacterium]CAA0093573.1 Formyltetrahydrofolate deformylase [BD1-7 clade bacterium]
MQHSYRLIIACPDKVGIVAEVSRFIAERSGWLLEASYHSERESNRFFMRNEIAADSLSVTIESFEEEFQALADKFEMEWYISDSSRPKRVVILASHASHCLADLLHRWHRKDLFCEVPAVISNHQNLKSMVEWHGVPYHYVEMTKDNKLESNAKIDALLDECKADVIVLARYMQIVPPELCRKYAGRIINIHHSFLPSFIGANPYQKAHDRGVKLIGATSHYVTENLDEGPIIEQDVVRVSHRHTKEDMVRFGKDVEVQVLSRGLRYHLEDRVMVCGNKTVILD